MRPIHGFCLTVTAAKALKTRGNMKFPRWFHWRLLRGTTSLIELPEFAREYVGKVKLAYLDPPFNTQQSFLHYDDALDTFGVHAVGGTLGAFLTGVLATATVNSNLVGTAATQNGLAKIVGHMLFSALEAPFRALALAPVSVAPTHQCLGIGSALIERGHKIAGHHDGAAAGVPGDVAHERAEVRAAEEEPRTDQRAGAARHLRRGAAAEGGDVLIEGHELHRVARGQ